MACEVKPRTDDPNQTRITIGGYHICFPCDVSTPIGSLELVELLFNSILLRRGAKFAVFDIKNLYLNNPLDRYKYVRIKLTKIPEKFITEYNLHQFDRWVYFAIRKGVYGLPQAGKLAYDHLTKQPNSDGSYQAESTPGSWRHKWCPVKFSLIVDIFGIEYVGKRHALHLRSVIKQYCTIIDDWKGKKCAGVDLAWDYS